MYIIWLSLNQRPPAKPEACFRAAQSRAAPSALGCALTLQPRAYARGYPGGGASRLSSYHVLCMISRRRRRATSAAPAVRGRPTVVLKQAPKARSIPAWGNAPGNKVQFHKKGCKPAALPSSRNSYSWGVAPGWYGAGLQPADNSTVGHPLTRGATQVAALRAWQSDRRLECAQPSQRTGFSPPDPL